MSTRSDTSARRVAEVVRKVRSLGVTAVFNENIANNKLIEQLENETSVVISGTLISGALSGDKARSYIQMMEYNLDLLGGAMAASDASVVRHRDNRGAHENNGHAQEHAQEHEH